MNEPTKETAMTQNKSELRQSAMEGPAAYAPHDKDEKKAMKPANKQGGAGDPKASKLEPEKQGGIGGP
jgi:hypothetical protein